MNEKKTKNKKPTKKKVKKTFKKMDKTNLKKVDVDAEIPVEEQFDFSIKAPTPVTIGIDGQAVDTSKLKRITIPRKALKPGQTQVPHKTRKPTLNTKTIGQSTKNFF
jgi:hypothetical protein